MIGSAKSAAPGRGHTAFVSGVDLTLAIHPTANSKAKCQILKLRLNLIFASGSFEPNIRKSDRCNGMRMLESDH